MNKPIAIIAGEPNSISSEIIFKCWKLRKKFKNKPFLVIGNINLFKLQKNKLNFKIGLKQINTNFRLNDLKSNKLPIIDIHFDQDKPFAKISSKSNKYIFSCFNMALMLEKEKKIAGFINCPVSKESLFIKKHQGITEFLSKKSGKNGKEVMLIFNKNLSVSPITTHIPFKRISKSITKNKIINNVKTINAFYLKVFNKKPNFGVLGLNPHNYSSLRNNEEKNIIKKAVLILKKSKYNISGPVQTDSSFMNLNKFKFDVIIGMYHDQVLTPFKALFKYKAINISLGLPYIRISPDHGVAANITGKNKANPESLIESIKFFNYIK